MAAKYLVTMPPGAPVPGVGFVKPGDTFTAPSVDYIPSKTFRPVNEEAQAVLEKLLGAKVPLVSIPREEPAVQRGLSLRELESLPPLPAADEKRKGNERKL